MAVLWTRAQRRRRRALYGNTERRVHGLVHVHDMKSTVKRYKLLTKEAQEVLYAALALRDKKGWCFLYARDDVKYQIVDIKKMKRLEKAPERYAPRR